MEYFNDNECTYPMYKPCIKCGLDARLEAKEDTRAKVTYYYLCVKNKLCKHEEILKN